MSAASEVEPVLVVLRRKALAEAPRRTLPVVMLVASNSPAWVDHPTPETQRAPRVRARTESMSRLSKRALDRGRYEYPRDEAMEAMRPKTRADCLSGPNAARPCPWLSCTEHLAYDENQRTGSLKENFPGVALEDMPETCALDVADRGGITLEEVGAVLNLTRERIRQLETKGLAKLAEAEGAQHLEHDLSDDIHIQLPGLRKGKRPVGVGLDPRKRVPRTREERAAFDALSALHDSFRCPTLHATLTVNTCLARQDAATHPSGTEVAVSTAPCRRCKDGDSVLVRLGPLRPAALVVLCRDPECSRPAGSNSEGLCPPHHGKLNQRRGDKNGQRDYGTYHREVGQ